MSGKILSLPLPKSAGDHYEVLGLSRGFFYRHPVLRESFPAVFKVYNRAEQGKPLGWFVADPRFMPIVNTKPPWSMLATSPGLQPASAGGTQSMENISPKNPEPNLTRELLEAVLDPHKVESDTADIFRTIAAKLLESPDADAPIDSGLLLSRYARQSEWQNFQQLIDESRFLQSVVDEVCDLLRPDPESIKREDLKTLERTLEEHPILRKVLPGADGEAEIFFRNRVITELERFFRAGWEARGAAEEAATLNRLMGRRNDGC